MIWVNELQSPCCVVIAPRNVEHFESSAKATKGLYVFKFFSNNMANLKDYKAVKGLIFYQNKALILEKEEFIGGKYEIPGGRKIDPKESDEVALKREVKEEVGLEIKVERWLNKWSLDLLKKGIHLDGKTYLCEAYTDKVALSEEHISYKWVLKEELTKLDFPIWLKEAISKL